MNLSVDVITHILSFGDRLPRYKGVSHMWMKATEQMYYIWKKHLDMEYPFWDEIHNLYLQKYYLQKSIFHSDWDSLQSMIDLGWSISNTLFYSLIDAIYLQGNWRMIKWMFQMNPQFSEPHNIKIYLHCRQNPTQIPEIIKRNASKMIRHGTRGYINFEMLYELKKYYPNFKEDGIHPLIKEMQNLHRRTPINWEPITPQIAEYMRKQNIITSRSVGCESGIDIYVFATECECPYVAITPFIAWCQGMHISVPKNALTMKLHERIAYINDR